MKPLVKDGHAVKSDYKIRIAICTQQPFVAKGLATVLRAQADLALAACPESPSGAVDCLKSTRPDILVVHLTSQITLADLRAMRSANPRCQLIIWGQELADDFTRQAILLGVRGILPGSTSIDDFLAALRNVHRGAHCFEEGMLESVLSQERVTLSSRQGQIVSMVAQGFPNKRIAYLMGITEGTVKAYLHKLFQKLGVNNRVEMAVYGQKNLFSGLPGLEEMTDTRIREELASRPVVPHSLLYMARKQSGLGSHALTEGL